ncbi:hypothetical protein H7Y40_00445 [Pedobacter sp.]|nr:hypothetical protein [Candidatus Saccharibacteria bacterium]
MERSTFKQLVARHRLPFAVFAVIFMALVMTAISMSLYITSGTSSLDLSRPGYKQVRNQVVTQKSETFDDTGPMDEATAAQFKTLFDSQKKALDGLGNFSDASLADDSLQLQAR